VALVAVEATLHGLVPVAGFGVDGGDHAVFGDPPGDAERPVLGLLEVLADHGGEQLRGIGHCRAELTPVEQRQAGERVAGTRVDQRLAGLGVVPVDLGLGRAGVVVAAPEHGAQLSVERAVGDAQQAPQRRTDERDGVHGRHRVVERRAVQHTLGADQPCGGSGLHAHVKDPLRVVGASQACPHVDQHGVGELLPVPVVVAPDAGRVTPAGVEGETLHRLAVRQALEALQHHHGGHHRRRHRTATLRAEQIGEQLVGEQPAALAVQHRVNRVLRQHLVAEPPHIVEQVALLVGHPERHHPLPIENYSHVILVGRHVNRGDLPPRKTPAT